MLKRPFFSAGCICLLTTIVSLFSQKALVTGLIFLFFSIFLSFLLREYRGRALLLGMVALLSSITVNNWQEKEQVLHSLSGSTVSIEGVIKEAKIAPSWIRYEAEIDLLGDSFLIDLSSYDMEIIQPGQRFHGIAEIESKTLRWQNGAKVLDGRLLLIEDFGEDNSLSSDCLRIRSRILQRMDKLFSGQSKDIISAILLGEKADLSSKTEDIFLKSGSRHLLTVSGFHISLIVGGLYIALNKAGSKPKTVSLLLLPLIPLIALVEGATVSVNRAAIMAFIYYISLIFERDYDGLNSWGIAVLTVLLPCPAAVRSASFLLSYMSVLGIYLFMDPINGWLRSFLKEKHSYGKTDVLLLKLLSALSAGLAANVAIAPFLMYFFGSIPLLAPLSALLLIPIIPPLMVLSILAIFCPIPVVAQLLSGSAQLFAALLYRILYLIAEVDLVFYGQSLLLLVIFFLFYCMLSVLYLLRVKGRTVRLSIFTYFWLFIAVYCISQTLAIPSVELTSCRKTIVLCNNGSAVIVGVPERQSDFEEIEKVLHCSNVKQVDLLLFTREPGDDGLNALSFCEKWKPLSCQSAKPLDAFDLRGKSYLCSPSITVSFWDDWQVQLCNEGAAFSNEEYTFLKTHRSNLLQNIAENYNSIIFDDYTVYSNDEFSWHNTWDFQPILRLK